MNTPLFTHREPRLPQRVSFPFPARPKSIPPVPLIWVGRTIGGYSVYDRPQSHNHLSAPLLEELLSHADPQGRPFVEASHHFGRVIGQTDGVATGPNDEVVFARREGRHGLTRFVKNRKPEPTEEAFAVLKRKDDQLDAYLLITAFAGKGVAPEPWDRWATAQSLPHWNTHALIWGSCPVVPGTETMVCPW